MLEVKGLLKRFGGLVAISDFDFKVPSGELVGIIGPNGAGKTTLFNLMTGFYRADQGRVVFDGVDITGWPPHRVCQIGLVRTFQVVRPLSRLSVFDNIMAGALLRRRITEARDRVKEVLRFCKLYDKQDNLAGDLTIADRKRLELARVIATSPKMVLLDEVAAGLNPAETEEMIGIIRGLKELDISAVVGVEHVMRFIMEISDRIVVIHHGEKIAEGSPTEIAQDEGVIAAYLGKSNA